VVVVSTAVSKDNPEVLAAQNQGVAVVQRAEMLAELMRLKFAVAIGGTHGKTTTTSLMAALFDEAELNPTIINGGILNAYNTNARLGTGDWVIAEADESDGSFVKLFPTFAVVTNIDADHLDFYKDFDAIKAAFMQFLERVPFCGAAILCSDHPEVQKLLPELTGKRTLTYGLNAGAQIRAVNLHPTEDGIAFDVDITPPAIQPSLTTLTLMPRRIRGLFLPMMGNHNVQNALAVVAIAQELGINDQVLIRALRQFKGVKRRFTKVGTSHGMTIIDDYAHHPVEIETTLKAAHQATQGGTKGRVIAVLQPHRHTRFQALFEDFVTSLLDADAIILAPIYSAGEKEPSKGMTVQDLAQRLRDQEKEVYEIEDPKELPYTLRHMAQKNDLVVCMGAGSITYWAASLPAQLDQLLFDVNDAASPAITAIEL
ncbi:MAG: UDP-N-acetylmuramate--L-alanine ligase, partial [Alphaproteobacteria bacterium]|nr:UDP-N-acetylmuramate--L-alanine ligase [Alphaproteobacteria bacterium]